MLKKTDAYNLLLVKLNTHMNSVTSTTKEISSTLNELSGAIDIEEEKKLIDIYSESLLMQDRINAAINDCNKKRNVYNSFAEMKEKYGRMNS